MVISAKPANGVVRNISSYTVPGVKGQSAFVGSWKGAANPQPITAGQLVRGMRSKQMNGGQHNSGPEFLKEIENNQRNVVWPGPLVNSRGVDEFFWKGSPKPTVVQRIAAWLFGLTFIGIAFSLFYLAWSLRGSAWAVFGGGALLFALIGVRHIWSGVFKRNVGSRT
jgi:hypothetical protein